MGQAAIGDFNGDGKTDVAVGTSDGVYLLTGNGDGTLNPAQLVVPLNGLGENARAIDFNGDGKLDVAVVECCTSNGVFVALGNGDGTFQAPITLPSAFQPSDIQVGPLVKNGTPGIVLSNYYDVELYFGNGKGGFSKPETIPLTGAVAVAIADLNGDGNPDIVDVEGYAIYGLGSGKFSVPVQYPIALSGTIANVVAADVNGDGRPDVITTSTDANSVLLNVGRGKFEDGIWTTLPESVGCVATGDFNGDGYPDLALNTANSVQIVLGTGKASNPYTPGANIPLPVQPGCLKTAADVNNDGRLDLVVPTTTGVTILLGNGDGTFSLGSSFTTAIQGLYAVLGDFNRDGNVDIVTSGNVLALGNGDGTFQTPTTIMTNLTAFINLAVGDINNDGWPDIVVSSPLSFPNGWVLLNNHRGGFTQVKLAIEETASQVTLGDFNRDGNLDIISESQLYLGNGKGEFEFKASLPIGSPCYLADLNGDGILDVASLGHLGVGSVNVLLGNGDGTFVDPAFAFGAGPAPGDFAIIDAHGQALGSGLPDIVAPDTTGGLLTIVNMTKK